MQSYPSKFEEIRLGTPLTFGVHDAQQARLCAEVIFDDEDPDFVRWVLSEGCKKLISAKHSRDRARAKRMAEQAVKNARRRKPHQLVLAQLQYMIVAPGHQSLPLGDAIYEYFDMMFDSESKQVAGRLENLDLVGHWRDITRPFPGIPVSTLVQEKKLSIRDLFPIKVNRRVA